MQKRVDTSGCSILVINANIAARQGEAVCMEIFSRRRHLEPECE